MKFIRSVLILLLAAPSLAVPAPYSLDRTSYFPIITDIVAEFDKNPDKLFVILVTQPGCHYCEIMATQVLIPLDKSKKYQGQVIYYEISLDKDRTITDLQGRHVDTPSFLKRYDVNFSPTLLFVNRFGKEVHKPIKGLGTLDFASYYVEKAIDEGIANLAIQ